MSRLRQLAVLALLSALFVAAPATAQPTPSPDVVISQVYGGGGNSGATLRNDFIELYNRGTASVDVSGWSVQYGSATGALSGRTNLSGSIAPGRYYLVQEAAGTGGTTNLPTPDATGTIAMSATAGKVALVTAATTLACGTTGSPCPTRADVRDFVGYGGANDFEGAGPAPGLSNTTADVRNGNCVDTNNNNTDFSSGSPDARNSSSAPQACGAAVIAPISGLRIHDIQGRQHVSPYNRAPVIAVPGVVTTRRTNGYFMQDPRPDDDERTSEGIFVFTGGTPAADVAPGAAVTVSGRVSEFRPGGAGGIANLSTTEITGPTTTVDGTGAIAPTIIGRGGREAPSEIIDNDTVDPGGEDPPTLGGDVEAKSRPAPAEQDPAFDPSEDGLDFYESLEGMLTEVPNATAVGPTSNFGSNRELPVVADTGADATGLAARGPLVVRAFDQTPPQEYRLGDFNPERIILNDTGDPTGPKVPLANVRDRFTAPVDAVVDYNFGNVKFLVVNQPPLADGGLQPEQARDAHGNGELSVASYNLENLDGLDPQARYDRIARQIIDNLRSPDIISTEEIQDNDGAATAAPTASDLTHHRLIKAIQDAGGPTYDYRQIDPAANQDGGEPNGNIRVSLLFRTDRRDLEFVDHPGATATTATRPIAGPDGADITFSPGRIDPTNPVFANSRKPLVGEFTYRGEPLFVIGNHFNSKGGDDPAFGRFQEPRRSSEVQRRGSATDPSDTTRGQAGVVNRFVRDLLAIDPRAHVIALGDLNDFDFAETTRVLETGGDASARELTDLWRDEPQSERYSYIFQGNAQVLDHILVSPGLQAAGRPAFDVVHINAEFADQASDHDPPIAWLKLNGRGHSGRDRGSS